MSHQNALVNYLTQLGVSFADANDAAQLTTLSSEALDLLGRKPDGTLAPTAAHDWEEWLSDEHTRYYYVNKPAGLNQWDAPLAFRFLEWALDAHLYGISIRLARDIYQRIDGVVSMNPQDVAWRALGTLSKMLTNVAGCNNSVEKYRTVRVQNPAFKAAVYNVPGALAVLQIAGFKLLGETVAIPADAPMAPLRATAARVQRYSSGKGHSGTARVDDSGRTGKTRPPSPYYGTAGFMYQEQIWHCGACDHAVNDGSERLWTGRVDAPEGEFRYLCTTCSDTSTPYNLCQRCYDSMQQGKLVHAQGHAFEHIGPRLSRRGDYYNTQGSSGASSNPWGNRALGAGYSRGLARLHERYGISTP